MRNWFTDCATVESIKTRYRDLAKQNHPDLGGSTETMQQINAAYTAALKACDGQTSHDATGKAHQYRYNEEREAATMEKIQELLALGMDGVDVYMIGAWVWVLGETKPYKEALKAAGCIWHSKRKCWYWREAARRHRGRSSRGSLSDLAMRYGCERFEERETRERGQMSLAVA